ncbi:hypothetical protein Zm00014a_036754 [Zea mays]|uniref:Uncharacterized protein n=1 Tax=Zea mays TaxID=4577 RepID=A0A3L6DVA3_MAIZE|nr:hypothetical protein Zm00014a_036754 [Zea mays]
MYTNLSPAESPIFVLYFPLKDVFLYIFFLSNNVFYFTSFIRQRLVLKMYL